MPLSGFTNVAFKGAPLGTPGGRLPKTFSMFIVASPSCFRLLTHWARRAASRADCTAGKSKAIRTAMIAITTKSSISVKPTERRAIGRLVMEVTSWYEDQETGLSLAKVRWGPPVPRRDLGASGRPVGPAAGLVVIRLTR